MRATWLGAGAAMILGTGLVAGCGSAASAGNQAITTTGQSAVATAVTEAMTIKTGTMDHKKGWPMFTNASWAVQKGQTVTLTITSYDDGAAPLPKGSSFGTVQGTKNGDVLVNGKTVQSIPRGDIAHTFTVSGLGLNIPIPVAPKGGKVTVTATFVVKKTGTFVWQCMAPCGTGSSGWGGPMQTRGYMQGTVIVKA